VRQSRSERVSVTKGFLVLKRFEPLFREFAAKPEFDRRIYALPVFGDEPSSAAIRYRGLDRDAIEAYAQGSLAEIRMAELDPDDNGGGFIGTLEQAREVLRWAEEEAPGVYEIAWAQVAGTAHTTPAGFELLGFEPSYFTGDHFSASCDCLCFPRWHGTDREGVLFREHFTHLNANGLFRSAQEASEFLRYYLSFDWTETGEYEIAEVWAPAASSG
jgi:hypothetical protein